MSAKELTSLGVTEDRVRVLRSEAGEHGDTAMVKICDLALGGNVDAFRRVLEVLRDNGAQR